MQYALIAEDRINSLAAHRVARPAHLERRRVLQDEGRQLLTGACPAIAAPDPVSGGFRGSLVVAKASRAKPRRLMPKATLMPLPKITSG